MFNNMKISRITITTVLLCTLHIEILVWHAVVWDCTYAHYTEGVAHEASKEAIDFKCSLEQIKLQTFVAALFTSTR